MKVKQIGVGRVAGNQVNQQKAGGFVQDSGLSALGGAVGKVASQFEQAQVEIDQTYAEEARIGFDKELTSIFHDPDKGYFNTSGKNAYEGQADAIKAMTEARKKWAASLSPAQQRMFAGVADKMISSNEKSVMTHAANGRKVWDIATQEAVVENSVEKAIINFQNDDEIRVQLATMRQSISNASKTKGIGPEATNERLQTATSKFYSAVLNRAISDDFDRAENLLGRYGEYLEPDDRAKIDSAMKSTMNKRSAFASVDKWISEGLTTSEAMTEAQKIKDPEVRQLTENRFLKQQQIKATEQSRIEIEATDRVYQAYSSGADVSEDDVKKMGGKARLAFLNIQRKADEEKKAALEEAEEERTKATYESAANQVFNGASWDSIKEQVSSLPVSQQKAIKTLAEDNKNASLKNKEDSQEAYYENVRKRIALGDISYRDIKGTEFEKRLTAEQIEKLSDDYKDQAEDFDERLEEGEYQNFANQALNGATWDDLKGKVSNMPVESQLKIKKIADSHPSAIQKKKAEDRAAADKSWQYYVRIMKKAEDDPETAMRAFYDNADVFGDKRESVYKQLVAMSKGGSKAPKEINTTVTIASRIGNITKDPEAKFKLMKDWDTYQAGIFATESRKPNKAETDAFFASAIEEVVTHKGLIWDSKEQRYETENFGMDALNTQLSNAQKKTVMVSGVGAKREITYPNGDVKFGGSRAWRNNNPGNLEYGEFAKEYGAIGTDGRFAIFPDRETGDAAKIALLKGSKYKDLTISKAIAKYAPQFENDTAKYAKTIASAAGVPVSTVLSSMTDEQFKKMVDEMTKFEGWKEGATK